MTALNGSTTRMGNDDRSFSHDNTSSWCLPHVSTGYDLSGSVKIVVIKLSLILNYLLLHVLWLPQISSKPILDNKHYLRFLRMGPTRTRCRHKRQASLHRKSRWSLFLYHWVCLIPQYFQLVVDLASVAFQNLWPIYKQ